MDINDIAKRWRGHSPMTDPREHAALLRDLPSDASAMCQIVAHLLIHSDWLSAYGVANHDFGSISRETFPVSARLSQVRVADGRSLLSAREPRMRSIATCRDFAVLLCSMLRSQGTIARVRAALPPIFAPGRWEDHWVCERWVMDESRWAVADAQMDDVLRSELRTKFEPADLPPAAFLPAGEAWLRCRSGQNDPTSFGHGAVGGLWFVYVKVHLNGLTILQRIRIGF